MAFSTSAFPMGQLILATLTLTAIVFCPSSSGAVLMIPLTPSASVRLPALALHGGGSLLARGPFKGSLVVQANNIRIGALASAGILTIAARGAGCGSTAGSDPT
jgi:hypothetical protein